MGDLISDQFDPLIAKICTWGDTRSQAVQRLHHALSDLHILIEGGMTNAQQLVIRLTMKPIPTLIKPLDSIDIVSHEPKKAHKERTDSCAVPAASIIAENLLCIVIADTLLSKFGGDSMNQFKMHMKNSAKY